MTPAPRDDDLHLARDAARAAGAAIRARFGRQRPVRYKAPDQPVTEADEEADRVLRGALLRARPGYGWISEESASAPAAADGRVWVVDPLDGTVNFVQGVGDFTVSVGLLERGTPVLGVVYNPMTDELYHAVQGEGAFRDGLPIHAGTGGAGAPVLVVSLGERAEGGLDRFVDGFRVTEVGSTTLKIARVAEGRADAYVSVGMKGVWDVCAAEVIAAEAGAVVLDGEGRPLRYEDPAGTIAGLIAVDRSLLRLVPDLVLRLGGSTDDS
jgi:myo-inositol-1(or 4)-monophosphatase